MRFTPLLVHTTLTLGSLGLVACSDDPAAPASEPETLLLQPEALAPDLDALLDAVVDGGTTGIALFVQRPGREPYLQTRGLADVAAQQPLTGEHLFRMASMAKPYLSTLLVKLATEGRLSLDEPITTHLPAEITALIPRAEEITLYDMLTFQSGIVDYRDLTFTFDVLFGDHAKVRDEYTDLMDGLRRNPTPCSPPRPALAELTPELGECLYSNTNFVLAGYIADKVLYGVEPAPGARPEHHSRAFHDQLFEPLGLVDTVYEKHLLPGQSFSERLAHGYVRPPLAADHFDARGELTDITGWDDGNGYANGGLISSLPEIARFRRAVFDAQDPFPMQTFADKARFLALLQTQNELGVGPGGATHEGYWFIGGDIGGYTSYAEYSPERDVSILLYSNDRDYEPLKFDLSGAVEALVANAAP